MDPPVDPDTVNLDDYTDAEVTTDRCRLMGTIEPPHGVG